MASAQKTGIKDLCKSPKIRRSKTDFGSCISANLLATLKTGVLVFKLTKSTIDRYLKYIFSSFWPEVTDDIGFRYFHIRGCYSFHSPNAIKILGTETPLKGLSVLVKEHCQDDKRHLGQILLEQLGLRAPGVRLEVGVVLQEEKDQMHNVVLQN